MHDTFEIFEIAKGDCSWLNMNLDFQKVDVPKKTKDITKDNDEPFEDELVSN